MAKKSPFDKKSIDIHSDKFFIMVSKLMINKHNDKNDDFNLLEEI